jgi:hypothetical protein
MNEIEIEPGSARGKARLRAWWIASALGVGLLSALPAGRRSARAQKAPPPPPVLEHKTLLPTKAEICEAWMREHNEDVCRVCHP